MSGKIYETPTPTAPVLSYYRGPTGYEKKGLIVPSSVTGNRLMLAGLVPDANICVHPESRAKLRLYYSRTVDPDGKADATLTRNASNYVTQEATYDHDTGETGSGMTEDEIEDVADANYAEAVEQVAVMTDRFINPYAPATYAWDHAKAAYTKPFPQNDIPAACDVRRERYAFTAWGNVRTAWGRVEQEFQGSGQAIIFPGARVGARVKATLRIEDATIEVQHGLFSSLGGPAKGVAIYHTLHLMEGSRVWTTDLEDPDLVGTWPDSVPVQGVAPATFSGSQTIELGISNSLDAVPTTDTFPKVYTNPVAEFQVEFAVPASRMIVPLLQFSNGGFDYYIYWLYVVNASASLTASIGKATLTINRIGT